MKEEDNTIRGVIQSQEKMRLYLSSLTTNQDFVSCVMEIRNKFPIPINGFPEILGDEFLFIRNLPDYVDGLGNQTSFEHEVQVLAYRFGLTLAWYDQLNKYILYNDFLFAEAPSLVEVSDLREVEEEQTNDNCGVNILKNVTESFPVAILISPDATQRDIVDLVKKTYQNKIKPLQDKHKEGGSKVGKVRKRSSRVEERDMFICQNKHLPRKELVSLIQKKYKEILDYTYISKIIKKKCPRDTK